MKLNEIFGIFDSDDVRTVNGIKYKFTVTSDRDDTYMMITTKSVYGQRLLKRFLHYCLSYDRDNWSDLIAQMPGIHDVVAWYRLGHEVKDGIMVPGSFDWEVERKQRLEFIIDALAKFERFDNDVVKPNPVTLADYEIFTEVFPHRDDRHSESRDVEHIIIAAISPNKPHVRDLLRQFTRLFKRRRVPDAYDFVHVIAPRCGDVTFHDPHGRDYMDSFWLYDRTHSPRAVFALSVEDPITVGYIRGVFNHFLRVAQADDQLTEQGDVPPFTVELDSTDAEWPYYRVKFAEYTPNVADLSRKFARVFEHFDLQNELAPEHEELRAIFDRIRDININFAGRVLRVYVWPEDPIPVSMMRRAMELFIKAAPSKPITEARSQVTLRDLEVTYGQRNPDLDVITVRNLYDDYRVGLALRVLCSVINTWARFATVPHTFTELSPMLDRFDRASFTPWNHVDPNNGVGLDRPAGSVTIYLDADDQPTEKLVTKFLEHFLELEADHYEARTTR